MKTVVVGASGLIGSKLVNRLQQCGHEDIEASRASGVNTMTGEGLLDALNGADVVVDVSKPSSLDDQIAMDFFLTSGRNLIEAELHTGVKHHIILSIVGADRLPDSGYYRAKVAQEKLIQESTIPYTIVRSTQFFEFLGRIIYSAMIGTTVYISPAPIQPIAADDVAIALVEVLESPPVNGIIEIAGPECLNLATLAKHYLNLTGVPRKVVTDVKAPYFGAVLDEHSLVPEENPRIALLNFDEWFINRKS